MTSVLVTGGTGNLGRALVPKLVAAGYDVAVLSRRAQPDVPPGVRTVRGDLATGDGVDPAVTGAEVIVHCASGTGTARGLTYRSTKRTDVDATARMLDLAKNAGGSPTVVYISIVGIDDIPLGYYRGKLETERVITSSGLPHTILRTTQWHTLAAEFCRRLGAAPVIVAPKDVRLQLLDPGEVADRMLSLVQRGPAGRTDDMGGPEPLSMKDILVAYLDATNKRKRVSEARYPGKTMAALREGRNLVPEHRDGRITWQDWLARNVTAT